MDTANAWKSGRTGAEICVVVPCYNEQDRLPVAVFQAFAEANRRIDFLFVDDGSTDRTRDVITTMITGRENMDCLALPNNGGKAEAVRQGFLHALPRGYARIAYWDADLASPLSAIAEMDALLDRFPAVEMVLGSRVRLLGRRIDRTYFRHCAGCVFASAVAMAFGFAMHDSQCGAKMLRVTDRTQAIFAKPFLSRWIFDVELLLRLLHAVAETPCRENDASPGPLYEHPLSEWTDVAGSKLHFHDGFRLFYDLWRVRRHYGGLPRPAAVPSTASAATTDALPPERSGDKPLSFPMTSGRVTPGPRGGPSVEADRAA